MEVGGVEEGDGVGLEASGSVGGSEGGDGEGEAAEGGAGGGGGGEGGWREVGEDQAGDLEEVGFAGALHFFSAGSERVRTRLGR